MHACVYGVIPAISASSDKDGPVRFRGLKFKC